jgi:hypothetical protein
MIAPRRYRCPGGQGLRAAWTLKEIRVHRLELEGHMPAVAMSSEHVTLDGARWLAV